MANNKRITYAEFVQYITALIEEYIYREQLYEVGMSEVLGNLQSFDIALELLENILGDNNGTITEIMYEDNRLLRTERSLKRIYDILTERSEGRGTETNV